MVLLLEIARGIAALWVFFFHVKSYFQESSELIYSIAEYGHLGVPMFFVISGFVITYSAESSLKSEKSPFLFLKNRFLRIYPVFWISIIIVIFLPYLIELISMLKTGNYIIPVNLLTKYNFNEWFNFILLSKVFFAESSNLQGQFNLINAVYWTIAIEFQFYLIVFISLFLKRYYKYMIVTISGLALINIIYPFGWNYGLFIHYWPSFSVGILLAYMFKNKLDLVNVVSKRYKTYFSILSLGFIIIISISLLGEKSSSLLFAVIFGAALWCISPIEALLLKIKEQNKKVSYYILEGVVALGTMSYSVYLLHGKLHVLPSMFVRQVLEENSVFYGLVTILLTLLICYPFYYFVERPFMSKNYVKIHKNAL